MPCVPGTHERVIEQEKIMFSMQSLASKTKVSSKGFARLVVAPLFAVEIHKAF